MVVSYRENADLQGDKRSRGSRLRRSGPRRSETESTSAGDRGQARAIPVCVAASSSRYRRGYRCAQSRATPRILVVQLTAGSLIHPLLRRPTIATSSLALTPPAAISASCLLSASEPSSRYCMATCRLCGPLLLASASTSRAWASAQGVSESMTTSSPVVPALGSVTRRPTYRGPWRPAIIQW
jgi:hypothetical protein